MVLIQLPKWTSSLQLNCVILTLILAFICDVIQNGGQY
jgi:hypothetical protein